jgi:hypothetical protein
MSRGLDGRGPTQVQQHQRGYSLSFTPKTIVGSADNRIMDGSVCKHCPAVKFARPHRDPSTHQRQSPYIGPRYLHVRIFRWVPDTTSGHKLWRTDTGKSYQSINLKTRSNLVIIFTRKSRWCLLGLNNCTTYRCWQINWGLVFFWGISFFLASTNFRTIPMSNPSGIRFSFGGFFRLAFHWTINGN